MPVSVWPGCGDDAVVYELPDVCCLDVADRQGSFGDDAVIGSIFSLVRG